MFILAEDGTDRIIETLFHQFRGAQLLGIEFLALRLHLRAQALQLMSHLVEGAGLIVDSAELALQIDSDAGDERLREQARRFVQDHVRAIEHLAKKIELLAQNVKGEALGLILAREKAHDGDAAPLTVTVDASDTLFNALRIPREVVVDQSVAELKVQSLRTCLGRDEDFGA